MYLDPFEELGMAEKSAEQHRRNASEKEVRKFYVRNNMPFSASCDAILGLPPNDLLNSAVKILYLGTWISGLSSNEVFTVFSST